MLEIFLIIGSYCDKFPILNFLFIGFIVLFVYAGYTGKPKFVADYFFLPDEDTGNYCESEF